MEPATRRGVGRGRAGDGKVDVGELLEFIFPKSLQHPLSTGRLYAFGMYGPLDESGKLGAGLGGTRVVSAWEIDTMCLQFEREDILQVYISERRPLFVLSEAQKEEVIAQADSHLKTAKGRGYRRQVTRAEVIKLLSELPRDEAGLVSFHGAQRLIVDYREKEIARFRVIFPNLVAGLAKKTPRVSAIPSTAAVAVSDLSCAVGAGIAVADGDLARPASLTERESTGRSAENIRRRERGRRCKAKFSAGVAPPEMFIKDVGFTPAGMAKNTNMLLSTRAYKVGNIADSNDPGLTQNVRLIREDMPLAPGQGAWNPYACLTGKNIGSHVRSARSSTTAKRKC